MRMSLSIALTACLLLVGLAAPTVAAKSVVDCGAGDDLQVAIDAARSSATLAIRGTCVGHFDIRRDLRLKGVGSNPTLRGTEDAKASLVHVGLRADVTIDGLLLTGNHGWFLPGGGAVHNEGDLKLVRSRITDNWGGNANAIYNEGRVWLRDSRVTKNEWNEARAIHGGEVWARNSLLSARFGGIGVEKLVLIDSLIDGIGSEHMPLSATTMRLVRTTVRDGDTLWGGLMSAGHLTLVDSVVHTSMTLRSTISADVLGMRRTVIRGHHVRDQETACVLDIRVRASIKRSRVLSNAGTAVCITGSGTIADSVIRDNVSIETEIPGLDLPAHPGGIRNTGTLRVYRTRISDNSSGEDGGGIANAGDLRAHKVQILRNRADGEGGGIYNTGTVKLTKVRLWNNTPNDCTGC